MTIDEIKELIAVFNESSVGEMEVQRGENRLRLARGPVRQEVLVPPVIAAPVTYAPSPVASTAVSAPAPAPPKPLAPEDGHDLVKSPIVGTYYDAPSPGSPPFVKVGDQVQSGQVLCIIESMKLMNEIESEVSGTVVAKLVENGRPVEYGEALFAIRPR